MNMKIKINKVIANHYAFDTDIPGMPNTYGVWIMSKEKFDFVQAIIKQDLEQELSSAYYAEDRRWNLIAAWRRQLKNFANAIETVEAEFIPAAKDKVRCNDWECVSTGHSICGFYVKNSTASKVGA